MTAILSLPQCVNLYANLFIQPLQCAVFVKILVFLTSQPYFVNVKQLGSNIYLEIYIVLDICHTSQNSSRSTVSIQNHSTLGYVISRKYYHLWSDHSSLLFVLPLMSFVYLMAAMHYISLVWCKKGVTPDRLQWSYIFVALTHWYVLCNRTLEDA